MGANCHGFKSAQDLIKWILISLVSWILIIPLTIVSTICRYFVDNILRLKFKSKYGGLFDTSDVTFFLPDVHRNYHCSVMSVLQIKCHKETNILTSFRRILQEKVFDDPDLYPKLTGSMHVFAGYPYWIKNDVEVEEILKPLELPEKGEFDERYLKEIVTKISDQPNLRNGELLWEMYVSTVPLITTQKDGFVRYAVVCRFHHILADGTSLVALLFKLFGDQCPQSYSDAIFGKLFGKSTDKNFKLCRKRRVIQFVIDFAYQCTTYLEVIFVSLGRYVEINLFNPKGQNPLKNVNYSGTKYIVWATEPKPQAIDMIKHIRNKEGSKFVSVALTAALASITNYFKENSLPMPEYITGILPVLINFTESRLSKPAPLENKTAIELLNFPTTYQFSSLKSALRSVNELVKNDVKYADLLLIKVLWSFMGRMPLKLMQRLVRLKNPIFAFSNVPGGSCISVLEGCILERVVPVVPLTNGIRISFALVTYDGRLQIGMAVDTQLMISREKAQKIVDDVLLHIRLLHAESE